MTRSLHAWKTPFSLFSIARGKFVMNSSVSTRIFWYWDFENRSLRVDGKIDWSRDNNCDRVDKWWRRGDSGLQRLEAVVRAREQWVAEDQHAYNDDRKTLTFWVKDALSASEYDLCRFSGGGWYSPSSVCDAECGRNETQITLRLLRRGR